MERYFVVKLYIYFRIWWFQMEGKTSEIFKSLYEEQGKHWPQHFDSLRQEIIVKWKFKPLIVQDKITIQVWSHFLALCLISHSLFCNFPCSKQGHGWIDVTFAFCGRIKGFPCVKDLRNSRRATGARLVTWSSQSLPWTGSCHSLCGSVQTSVWKLFWDPRMPALYLLHGHRLLLFIVIEDIFLEIPCA